MKTITIICPGKIKDKEQLALEFEYRKRIKTFKLDFFETKIADDDKESEGQDVLDKYEQLSKGKARPVVLLKEGGKQMDSLQFSQWLFSRLESQEHLFFIFGGAAGHGNNVLKLPHDELSLSKMTFPHKLARIVLFEQLYRAETIKNGHPYHK